MHPLHVNYMFVIVMTVVFTIIVVPSKFKAQGQLVEAAFTKSFDSFKSLIRTAMGM